VGLADLQSRANLTAETEAERDSVRDLNHRERKTIDSPAVDFPDDALIDGLIADFENPT
jgi:hypothetical protein